MNSRVKTLWGEKPCVFSGKVASMVVKGGSLFARMRASIWENRRQKVRRTVARAHLHFKIMCARDCSESMRELDVQVLVILGARAGCKKQTRRDSWYSFDHSFTLLFLSFFHSLKRAMCESPSYPVIFYSIFFLQQVIYGSCMVVRRNSRAPPSSSRLKPHLSQKGFLFFRPNHVCSAMHQSSFGVMDSIQSILLFVLCIHWCLPFLISFSSILAFFHCFLHYFILSFIHSLTHSFIHLFMHACIH